MMQSFVPWVFGSLKVWPNERKIELDGVEKKVSSRTFDILLLLIENRDRVVTKAEIFERVWFGLVVEENNLTVQVSRLRKLLGTDVIATASGRGYRFMLGAVATPKPLEPPTGEISLQDKPSIAVMPFLHLATDNSGEYLTDSITEDITSELSRFHSLFVISRQSSFSYKGRHVDVRTVGQELGVRYVVEGSVRHLSRMLRVTSQLVDASIGSYLWAERFDFKVDQLYDIQDEIVGRIVVAVSQRVENHEAQALRSRPADWGAHQIAVEAQQIAEAAFRYSDQAGLERAHARAHEALNMDPGNVIAAEAKLFVLWQMLFYGKADNRAGMLNEALQTLEALDTLDRRNPNIEYYRGLILNESNQIVVALECLRKAIMLNPNSVRALTSLAMLEIVNGMPNDAIEHLLLAKRLSPVDPWSWSHNTMLAFAYIGCKDYKQALQVSQLAASQVGHGVTTHLAMACAFIGLGDLMLAREPIIRAIQTGHSHLEKLLRLLASGKVQSETLKKQLDLMLEAILLVDTRHIPETMQVQLRQLEVGAA